MSVIQAFLFDLDGTLVDTREANYLAYREAFAQFGHELSPAEFDSTWGRDSRAFVPELLPALSSHDVGRLRRIKSEAYEAHLGSTRLNTALVGFLASVSDGKNTALVTTAKSANARAVLAFHDLDRHFAFVIAGEDVAVSKPDPSCYLEALRRLDVAPGSALAFEDSDTGEAAASAAGIHVVRIGRFA